MQLYCIDGDNLASLNACEADIDCMSTHVYIYMYMAICLPGAITKVAENKGGVC